MTVVILSSSKKPRTFTSGSQDGEVKSIVAVMDSDTTGKLGFEEFKYLWNNIKKWQCVYKQYNTDHSTSLGRMQLKEAIQAAGFQLNEQLYQLIIRRYTEEDGSMDFNNFISCLIRLDAMFRSFKSLDGDRDGQIQVNIQEWLELTMYS
uniref:Calpain small subunit 2 n=1 Tax=Phascolarctos cinereus TaxID=38626 RepID=A0A6P5K6I3_PHACI|nr:calpain small subunit 2 [Phascolarctos cinereus]